MPGLGRIYQPDDRDSGFLMARKLPDESVVSTGARLWPMPHVYDQGDSPHCVGYSCSGVLTCLAAALYNNASVVFDAPALYAWANQHDGDKRPHDGSTVRSGLKGLQAVGDQILTSTDVEHQPLGLFDRAENYLWANVKAHDADIDRVIGWLLTVSPIVIGIDWSKPMYDPGPDGFVHPDPNQVEGGHAILVRGVNAVDPANIRFCMRNSWGGSWGVTVHDDWSVTNSPPGGGDALLSRDDLIALLKANGEAGAVVEDLVPIQS